MRRRWAGLVAGAAVLALGSGPGAWAEESGVPSPSPSPSVSPSVSGVPSPSVSGSPSPSADSSSPAPKGKAGIDATARMWPDLGSVWAGETFGIWAIAENLFETTPSLVLRLTLPEGVTYLGNMAGQTNGTCAPSGGRTLTCVADDGNTKQVMAKVRVKVADGLPPMTKLDFRAAADIGDAVDGNPANDVDDWTIRVMEPADVGVTWSMSPAGPVAAGTEVRTVFTVTNHGPGVSGSGTVKFYPGFDHWPTSMPSYPPCWVDPGVIICDRMGDLAPGETFSYSFTWKFPKKAAGTTYRVRGELYSASRHDPVSANDQAEAVFRIVKPKPTPKPTPSSGPTPSGSSSAPPAPAPSVAGGGGSLAVTGSGGLGAVGWGAVGLVGVGGALFGAGWTRARRRALDER
ncbi:hypothetical protein IAG44_15740 [Streptomyces roseirectus]|uniref:DUF11 domain-containing protein n=1 Tax=Streptomyces roseirectus TaxID=2768066 RepID=A0A7H0ID75_9ACTN|nr:hypothetical protein [Streptomyces roseirectus]QNP70741.1 hypothetical protein IAG44_15740 [Streptomyces roseirectus]